MIDQLSLAQEVTEHNDVYQAQRDFAEGQREGIDVDGAYESANKPNLDNMTDDQRDPEGDSEPAHDIKNEIAPGITDTTVFAENGAADAEKDAQEKQQKEKMKMAIDEYSTLMKLFANKVNDDREYFVVGNFFRNDEDSEEFLALINQLDAADGQQSLEDVKVNFTVVEKKLTENWFPKFDRILNAWDGYFDGWQKQENCSEQWGRIIQLKSELDIVKSLVNAQVT